MSNFNSINSIILVGRLVRSVDHTMATSGKTKRDYVRFSIATNEMYYSRKYNKTISKAEYHNVVAWGASAKFIWKYGVKGRVVSVLGKLRHRKWENKDGNMTYTTEVHADEITFIGRKDEEIKPKEEAMTEDDRDREEMNKGKDKEDINIDPRSDGEPPF